MADRPTILLVDDQESILETLGPLLERAGYTVRTAADGKQALRQIERFPPDLIVLDVLMPELDGRDVLRRLRQADDWTPVILLTQVGGAAERGMALHEGADDYLNKPFDSFELVARIEALLRRARLGRYPSSPPARLRCADLCFDRRSRRVWVGGEERPASPKVVALLDYMITHPGQLLTRDQLLDELWGFEPVFSTRVVDNCVTDLRRLLDDDPRAPRYIETVSGQGYRFIGLVETAP